MCLTFIDEKTKTDCEVGWQVMLRRKSDGQLISLFTKGPKQENKLLTAIQRWRRCGLVRGEGYDAGFHVLIEKGDAIYFYKQLVQGDQPYSIEGRDYRRVIKKVYPSGPFCSGTQLWGEKPLRTVVCSHIYIPGLKSVKKERVQCV